MTFSQNIFMRYTIGIKKGFIMPIFEYKCKECGLEFELLVSGHDKYISCSKCGSDNLSKMFSLFGMSGVEKQTSSGCSSCKSSSCKSCG